MASSEVGICNIALLRVGQRQVLSSMADTSSQGVACATLYPETRDSLLAEFQWSFATRRAALVELPGVTREGWDHAYQLPAGCLAPRYIWSGTRAPMAEERVPFELEDDATNGPVLLCDVRGASLIYTYQQADVTKYPPLFVQALSWKLAVELALVLPVKPAVAAALYPQYQAALNAAVAADRRAAQGDIPPESEFISGR